jgi:hypothetical protein
MAVTYAPAKFPPAQNLGAPDWHPAQLFGAMFLFGLQLIT